MALIRGDRERADQLIAAAASLNRHEYSALLLDAQRSWEGEDILRALNASDALLRTRPDLNRALFSAIAGLAESPAGRAIVKQRLSERPPWRDLFLASMYGGVRDATLPLDLMLHLKTSGVTIPQHAVNAYVEWLLSNRIYGFAYTAWLQLLDRERLLKVGFVYNGDFNAPLTGSPFDWTIRRGTGVSVEIADLPETKDNRALKIEMSTSRAQFGEVYQRLNLAPGDYLLTGRYRGEFAGRRGLQWRILCAEASQAQLAQTQMLIGQFKTWREFSIPVAIPPQGCTSQILRLVHDARYSAEQFGSGLIWFDDLRIARAMRTGAAPMAAEQSSVDSSGAPP